MTHTHVLLLDVDYRPMKIIPWQRAMTLLLEEKAMMVADYVGQVVRTVALQFERPAVVRMLEAARGTVRIRFNRFNVLARDRFTCQYCGDRPRKNGRVDLGRLTVDHVIPRAQAVANRVRGVHGASIPVTCWENVVACCSACNGQKDDRTPAQAGMTLRAPPAAPSAWSALRISMARSKIPVEWIEYLPGGAAWSGYWDATLE